MSQGRGQSDSQADVIITASEVHDYFYCPYAWWFKDSGIEAEQVAMMKSGTEYHRRLDTGQPVRRWKWLLLAAAVILGIAGIVFLLAGA